MIHSTPFILFMLVIVSQLLGQSDAHSYLLEPPPRYGLRGIFNGHPKDGAPACGWPNGSQPNPNGNVHERGDTIPFMWPRNNHPGGFIKLSLAPFKVEQLFADFEGQEVQWSCHENGCKADPAHNDPFSSDPGGSDVNPCRTQWKIPDHIQDGQYSIQWLWYGGLDQAHYFSCYDFTVRGGSPVNPNSQPACPPFLSGDAHNAADQRRCKHFGGNDVFDCTPSGCRRQDARDGIPKSLEQCYIQNPGEKGNVPQLPNISPSKSQGSSLQNQTLRESQPPASTPPPPGSPIIPQSSRSLAPTRTQPPNSSLPLRTTPPPLDTSGGEGTNYQKFSASSNGGSAPAVRLVNGKYQVLNEGGSVLDSFDNVSNALTRSCRIQQERCSTKTTGSNAVCNEQETACKANF